MLIVETAETEGAGARAGIQLGDQLLSYAGQPLLSPAMLQALEENTFGVQSVIVQVKRAGRSLEFFVPSARLGLAARRFLASALLPHYEAARAAFLAGMYADAAKQWTDMAERTKEEAETTAWLLGWAGAAWQKAANWDHAIQVYTRAWEQLQGSTDTAMQSQTATALGRCHRSLSKWQEAVAWYERASQADAQEGREMWQATSLNNLGVVAWLRGGLQAARDYHTSALTIRERLAPDSLDVAASLNNMGIVAFERGDLQAAQAYYTSALTIRERLAPDSLDVAGTLNNLGNVACQQGDLQAAVDYYTRALTIKERLAPNSMDVTSSLNNLGAVAFQRGDLAAAQDYYTRALTIKERLAPDSLDVAASLNNLGNIAWPRGDLQAAWDFYTRSLTIKDRLAPGSLDAAVSLNNLGAVAFQRGDLQATQDYYTRALVVRERLAPDSLDVAASLNNLGIVAFQRGDVAAAQNYYAKALTIRERLAPGSLDVAAGLNNLGIVAFQRGDMAAAQDYRTRALTIRERLAPGSLAQSETLTDLGQSFLHQQQPSQALPYLQQAVQIVEQQRSMISSPEARALLLAQHTTNYARLIQCYLALKQPELAFATLERSRARSLLELLAERQLDFAAEAPSGLLDQQRTLDQRREHAYTQLAKLSTAAEDTLRVDSLRQQIRDLERRQQELTAQLRAASPHYAALRYPQPPSLEEAQTALEPNTLLLSYLVDEEQTFLFGVTAQDLQPFSLPIGRKVLQEKVSSLRDLLDWRHGTNRLKENIQKAVALSRELYNDLIRPASKLFGTEHRLLLCPDGPLHILPFAALVTNLRGKPCYLGVEQSLQSILSATLYAQSKAPRPQLAMAPSEAGVVGGDPYLDRSPPLAPIFRRLLAFGDPVYSFASAVPAMAGSRSLPQRNAGEVDIGETALTDAPAVNLADTILEELQTRGLSLGPLPHTRTEVLALKYLFGDAVTVKLGVEATKTAALNESADAEVLHFACHGFVDAKMPLHSALVLSRSEASEDGETVGDSGFLQVWEIFQKMRINTELVVLSACETGLGQEVRGEGLIGLTRAFQYAGARNLVVSLWKVNDVSTSVFMEGFYGALKSGQRKEEAMRAGIAAVRSHQEWSAPYYWSAFVLIGSRT